MTKFCEQLAELVRPQGLTSEAPDAEATAVLFDSPVAKPVIAKTLVDVLNIPVGLPAIAADAICTHYKYYQKCVLVDNLKFALQPFLARLLGQVASVSSPRSVDQDEFKEADTVNAASGNVWYCRSVSAARMLGLSVNCDGTRPLKIVTIGDCAALPVSAMRNLEGFKATVEHVEPADFHFEAFEAALVADSAVSHALFVRLESVVYANRCDEVSKLVSFCQQSAIPVHIEGTPAILNVLSGRCQGAASLLRECSSFSIDMSNVLSEAVCTLLVCPQARILSGANASRWGLLTDVDIILQPLLSLFCALLECSVPAFFDALDYRFDQLADFFSYLQTKSPELYADIEFFDCAVSFRAPLPVEPHALMSETAYDLQEAVHVILCQLTEDVDSSLLPILTDDRGFMFESVPQDRAAFERGWAEACCHVRFPYLLRDALSHHLEDHLVLFNVPRERNILLSCFFIPEELRLGKELEGWRTELYEANARLCECIAAHAPEYINVSLGAPSTTQPPTLLNGNPVHLAEYPATITVILALPSGRGFPDVGKFVSEADTLRKVLAELLSSFEAAFADTELTMQAILSARMAEEIRSSIAQVEEHLYYEQPSIMRQLPVVGRIFNWVAPTSSTPSGSRYDLAKRQVNTADPPSPSSTE